MLKIVKLTPVEVRRIPERKIKRKVRKEKKRSEEIYKENPDYIIILAWRYADEIIAKHKNYQKNGGKFIVPLPEYKII